MQKLIILRGYPGSGKTTVGKELEKAGHGTFIDHNAILTFIAGVVSNDDGIYGDIHNLEKVLTKKLLNDGKSAIVARGFSSKEVVRQYTELASVAGITSFVIRLQVPTPVLEQRVTAPERLNDFNPTINGEALKTWIANNELEEVEGEHIIDASRQLSDVVKSAWLVINSMA